MSKQSNIYPDLAISISDQAPSGYFREDTIGSTNPIQKTVAQTVNVPTVGKGIRFVKVTTDNEGEHREVIERNVAMRMIEGKEEKWQEIVPEPYEIRYILGCPSIDKQWQDEHGWKPSPDPHSDVIFIEEGFAEIKYSENPAKYKYLSESVYLKDLPFRLEHILPIYTKVKENTKAVLDITAVMAESRAMDEWKKLVNEGKGGAVTFNTDKVNGYAILLNVQGETTVEKVRNLLEKLKKDPTGFLEKVIAYKEEAVTEVTHAIDLNLIKMEGNQAVFTFNNKRVLIGDLGAKGTKVEKLAELLKSEEHKPLLVALKSQIELAKEKQLN